MYGEGYYKGCQGGTNYQEYENQNRILFYKERVNNIIELLNELNLSINSNILDYGCATGILLKEFQKKGFSNIVGYDISEYGVKQTNLKGISAYSSLDEIKGEIDLTMSFDVFEHMNDKQLTDLFNKIDTKYLLVKIPVSSLEKQIELFNGKIINTYKQQTLLENLYIETFNKNFTLNISRQDKTHINLKTKEEWIKFLENLGFEYLKEINKSHLYNKKEGGVFTGLFIKNSGI